jgi:hypothetical protein
MCAPTHNGQYKRTAGSRLLRFPPLHRCFRVITRAFLHRIHSLLLLLLLLTFSHSCFPPRFPFTPSSLLLESIYNLTTPNTQLQLQSQQPKQCLPNLVPQKAIANVFEAFTAIAATSAVWDPFLATCVKATPRRRPPPLLLVLPASTVRMAAKNVTIATDLDLYNGSVAIASKITTVVKVLLGPCPRSRING